MADDFVQFAPQDPRMSQRDIIPLGVRNRQMGAVVQGTNMNVIDKAGLVSVASFVNSTTTQGGLNQSITSLGPTFTDVTNSSYTYKLIRTSFVLYIFSIDWFLVESAGNTGNAEVDLNIDGTDRAQLILRSGNVNALTLTGYSLRQEGAGTHTVKLRGTFSIKTAGAPSFTVAGFKHSYLSLGI